MRSLKEIAPNAIQLLRKHAHHDAASSHLSYDLLSELNDSLNRIEQIISKSQNEKEERKEQHVVK